MMKQLYYEDVNVGDKIPALTKEPSTRQLVLWAGASGDYNPIHYDQDYARSKGLNGVLVHGQLVAGFLGQLLTDWAGEQGTLRRLICSYRGINLPGESITCHGEVNKKYIEEGRNQVLCLIWAENNKGDRTVAGRGTVVLPSRD